MRTLRPRSRFAGPVEPPPTWIKPQLAKLVDKAPEGPDWLHEIKFDGYRMHARLDGGRVQILTRRGNDWTNKYPAIAYATVSLKRLLPVVWSGFQTAFDGWVRSEVLLYRTQATVLDGGAPLDDAGDRGGPPVGRLLKG